MKQFYWDLEVAKQKLRIADHMVFMTFPLVKDNKLLIASLENLLLAIDYAITALLNYERTYKRIPPFNQNNFESKFSAFKNHCVARLNISPNYTKFITEIRELVNEHKKSPVEFSRKDKFVICSLDYNMKTVSIATLKKYIKTTRDFINLIESLIKK